MPKGGSRESGREYKVFAEGLKIWRRIENEVDFYDFHDALEMVKGFRVSQEYSERLFKMIDNPMKLYEKLGERLFTKLMKFLIHEGMQVRHPDLDV